MDSILIYLLFSETLISIQTIYIGITENDNQIVFVGIIVLSSLILLLRLITFLQYLPIQKYVQILGQSINILQTIAIYLCIQYQITEYYLDTMIITIFLRRENNLSSQSSIILLQMIAFIMTIGLNAQMRDQTVLLILNCSLIFINTLLILIKNYCFDEKETKISQRRIIMRSQCVSEVQIEIDFCVSLKDAEILVINNQGQMMFDNSNLHQYLFEQDKMNKQDLIQTFLELVQTSNQDKMMNLFQYISQDPDQIHKQRGFTFMKNNYFDFSEIQIIVYYKRESEYFIIQFIKIDQNLQSQQSDIQLIDLCRSLSHELVTNLNSISTFSLLAMNESKISESVKVDYLVPILINTEQLQLIINNIRDFNLISLGQFNLKIEEIDIQLEIQNVCQLFQPSLNNKKIRLIQDYKQCPNKIIENDRQRLRQIVFQLMQNAVKYTSQGFIKIEVECDHSLLRIAILDTGIGLKQDEFEKIQLLLNQNKFAKISNNSVGAGIGLSISNMIVLQMNDLKLPIKCNLISEGTQFTFFVKNYHKKVHKRSLDFKSSKQTIKFLSHNSYYEGSDFLRSQSSKKSLQIQTSLKQQADSVNQFSFPQFEDEDLQTHVIQYPPILVPKFQQDIDQQIDYQSLKSKCCHKVLIVDDEYFNILCLQMILSKVNVKCDNAYNGNEALSKIYMKMNDPCRICANNHYQLIFLDINMPILDGFKTVKEIKKLMHQNIIQKAICVANTGFCDLQTRVQAFEAGMDYFMTKPVDQQTVIDILQGFR